jgi:hypothetical protein
MPAFWYFAASCVPSFSTSTCSAMSSPTFFSSGSSAAG